MKVVKEKGVAAHEEGAARVRVYMTPAGGMSALSITQVDLRPGSSTPDHSHDTDQIVYILEGEARFVGEGERHTLSAGDLIYVPAGEVHRHECAGDGVLRQLSLFVPARQVMSNE